MLSYRATKTIFTVTRTSDRLPELRFSLCNPLVGINNSGVGTGHLPRLVYETTGTRTQDNFAVLTSLKYHPCFKASACQVWYKLVYPFSCNKRTHTYFHTHPQRLPDDSLRFIRNPVLTRYYSHRCTRHQVASVLSCC